MPKTKPKTKGRGKPTAEPPQPDSPYRQGTLYSALFEAGCMDYVKKDELIAAVAGKTGKTERSVSFAYAVLKSPKHRSNGNRSAELKEGDRVKLIAIRKRQ